MSNSRKAILHDAIIRGGVHDKPKKSKRAQEKRDLKKQLEETK